MLQAKYLYTVPYHTIPYNIIPYHTMLVLCSTESSKRKSNVCAAGGTRERLSPLRGDGNFLTGVLLQLQLATSAARPLRRSAPDLSRGLSPRGHVQRNHPYYGHRMKYCGSDKTQQQQS